MLASYAGDDDRAFRERQRWLDSDSLCGRSGTSTKGVHDNIPLTHKDAKAFLLRILCPHYAGRQNECHDVLS
jgi:hypothetical protein